MKKFFNVVPGKNRCAILLYGYIGDYEPINSADVFRELYEAEETYEKIDIRINSNGGDVHAGIAIFNALRNSKADITIYIDGVAASIASVIAACGKPVQMSKYAKLMIHRVSGSIYGNLNEIEEYMDTMKKVEQTIIDIYAERTGLTADEIEKKYFDGSEHWLSAEEALKEKFIDAVYDVEPIPEDSTPEQVYSIFQNRLKRKPLNSSIMFENLKKRKLFANCATEEAAEKIVDELEKKAEKAESLEKENKKLKADNDAYREKEKEAHDAEIENILENARKEERFGENDRETYRSLLKADFTNGKKAIDMLKPKKRAIKNIQTDESGDQKPSAWDTRMKEIRNNLKK